jgi:hypothetical protein
VPLVSGANGLRSKLVNTGKQVLNLASYNFTGLAGKETIKDTTCARLRPSGNMVSAAVDLLDSIVPLVRLFALNLS